MGRPTTLPKPWRTLAEKLGGVQAVADVMDCDVRTVRRWAEELPRCRRARGWIHAAFQISGIDPPC
jgi:hypothetical protein